MCHLEMFLIGAVKVVFVERGLTIIVNVSVLCFKKLYKLCNRTAL